MPLDLQGLLDNADSVGRSDVVASLRRRNAAAADRSRAQRGQLIDSLSTMGAQALTTLTGGAAAGPSGGVGTVISGAQLGKGRGADVVRAAQQYLGTPYVWGGTTKQGIDCSGLLYAAARRAGIPASRLRASGWGKMGTAVAAPNARPGDVVYFDNPGATDHAGIYVGGGKFIEAQQRGTNVMYSNLRRGAQIRRVW